jgi:hypothetical protein
MISSIKSICLVLLLLLLAGFFSSTAFCKEKSKDSVSSSMDSPSRFAGKLSICPPDKICIQFLTRHAKFTEVAAVGDLVYEYPSEVLTTDQADLIPIQKASYIAFIAWQKCQEAKKLFEEAKELFNKGKIPSEQVQKLLLQWQWSCARARRLSAQETMIGTEDILDNLGMRVEWAAPSHEIAKLDFESAEQAEQNAIDLGAVPSLLGYEPPGEGEGGLPPTINLSDPSNNQNLILDTLPIADTGCASPPCL